MNLEILEIYLDTALCIEEVFHVSFAKSEI